MAKTELKANDGPNLLIIDSIKYDNLIVYNGLEKDVTIMKVEIEDVDCSVTGTYSPGINKIILVKFFNLLFV